MNRWLDWEYENDPELKWQGYQQWLGAKAHRVKMGTKILIGALVFRALLFLVPMGDQDTRAMVGWLGWTVMTLLGLYGAAMVCEAKGQSGFNAIGGLWVLFLKDKNTKEPPRHPLTGDRPGGYDKPEGSELSDW